MAFLDIFKKKQTENVGGMEDFMTLIRVYFQSVLAANLGISNLAGLYNVVYNSKEETEIGRAHV